MKRVFNHLRPRLRDLRLRWKILSTFLLVLLCSAALMIFLYQFNWQTYRTQLFTEVAGNLTLTSQSLESEMSMLQTTVSSIATSRNFQSAIRAMENAEDGYNAYSHRRRIISMVADELKLSSYILSSHYVTPDLLPISIGTDTSIHSSDIYSDLYDIAREHLGRPVWVTGEDQSLILVCAIRETEDLSLRDMGMIIVRVLPSQLLKETVSMDTDTDDMLIFSNGNLFYHIGEIQDWTVIPEQTRGQSYTVATIDDEARFIVHARSEYCDFEYYYCISYDNLMYSLRQTRDTVIILYALFIVLFTCIALVLSSSITAPMHALVKKMSHPAEQAFEKDEAEEALLNRGDEVGLLAAAYQDMLDTIEDLIDKNYVQQLTIKDTQYRSLQAQFNPHFIYNTLDSIYWMAINSDEQQIADMTMSLGKLMRESIVDSAEYGRLIPLRKELINLQHYIRIQKIRYGSQLEICMEVEEDTLDLMVPRMILQPLVENSIHYSVETISGDSTIWIKSRRCGDCFELLVEDTGIGVEPDIMDKLRSNKLIPKGTGVGLNNILQRLQMLYDQNAHMDIQNRQPHGAVVLLRLPLER